MQFVELRMLAAGQQFLGEGADLVLDDASGSADTRRVFTFTHDVALGSQGTRILIGTASLAAVSGVTPDFVLPDGVLAPRVGRVCYRVYAPDGSQVEIVDCVAYGAFVGDNGPFGPPTPITPDNRSLQRVTLSRLNADDWAGALSPTPQNNLGQMRSLDTLCGDGLVSQGEECDGAALGGASCASLGFASGTLACEQCHFDSSRCSFCGNGAINGKEECDGTDVGGRRCEALGFTGGALGCTERCRLTTESCSPTFLVPGGGPPGPECLAEWLVTNAGGRPGPDGRATIRQRCKDGDAGCDGDPAAGRCLFTVALCFDHDDARFAKEGRRCRRAAIESWTLLAPGSGGDADALLAAVAAIAPSTASAGVVTFAPPLESSERCTEPVALGVATRGTRAGVLKLRARTVAAGGRPRDVDALKLVCMP